MKNVIVVVAVFNEGQIVRHQNADLRAGVLDELSEVGGVSVEFCW